MGSATHRPSLIISNGSSLRPPSTASGASVFETRSARSSSGSVVPVRWDEEGIRSSQEMQRKGAQPPFAHSVLHRDPLFSPPASVFDRPIVTVEETTADGHGDPSQSPAETPVKQARPRPVSEQLLGRSRPQAICEDSHGVLFILEAATNDHASLINRLDLEASPASSANTSPIGLTPFQSGGQESPLKKCAVTMTSPLKTELRESMASISSLRPYAKAQNTAAETVRKSSDVARYVGQQIAPWSELDWQVSPKKEPIKTTVVIKSIHRRTLIPAPDVEPPPVFKPLRPAKP
ncbi:hypothetical protein OBBRIDRAFT_840453, partial [Obba rivulosa]